MVNQEQEEHSETSDATASTTFLSGGLSSSMHLSFDYEEQVGKEEDEVELHDRNGSIRRKGSFARTETTGDIRTSSPSPSLSPSSAQMKKQQHRGKQQQKAMKNRQLSSVSDKGGRSTSNTTTTTGAKKQGGKETKKHKKMDPPGASYSSSCQYHDNENTEDHHNSKNDDDNDNGYFSVSFSVYCKNLFLSRWESCRSTFDPRQPWFSFPEEQKENEQHHTKKTMNTTTHTTNSLQDVNYQDTEEGGVKTSSLNNNKNGDEEEQQTQETQEEEGSLEQRQTLQSQKDYHENFAPASKLTLIIKACSFNFSLAVFFNGFAIVPGPFILAYFTYWGVTMTAIYLGVSFFNSILHWRNLQKDMAAREGNENSITGGDNNEVVLSASSSTTNADASANSSTSSSLTGGVLILRYKFTWALLTVAVHSSFMAGVLYWPAMLMNWEDKIQWYIIASHGGLFLLALIDGFFINNIPLKWLHWFWMVVPFEVGYCLWSFIHSRTDMGNPDLADEDPETNDDALYPGVLEWRNDPSWSLITCVVAVFVIGPAVFSLLRWISRLQVLRKGRS